MERINLLLTAMNIFRYTTYKAALKQALAERQQKNGSASLAGLADAARIQRSYLSKVFNQGGQLSADQLYLACRYLRLSSTQTRYVELLSELERTTLEERKELILKAISKIRSKALATENYISVANEEERAQKLALFHLSPNAQLVHMFLSIERYIRSPDLIREELGLSKKELNKIVDLLTDLNLIQFLDGAWVAPTPSMHLKSDSDYYPPYRVLMRQKALVKLQQSVDEDNYSFSVILSSDPATRIGIQQAFLTFLSKIQPLVKKSNSEQVYQMNFDLLRWSERD